MTFSEDAIRSVGARLKRDLDDEKIRAILQAEESRDIQAAPGSGKTSVMGAKLTLLARSWPYANRGICILSHTNVAKDEIAELLAKTSEGRQLLKPPHFLGTIQSFVNQVFALPYIRACGLPFEALDESRHARLAKQYFSAEKYRGTRYYLAQKHTGGDVEDFAGSLEFVNSPREIRHAIPLPGKDTDTYKNLLDVKQRVAAQGIYRYNDMYAFAHAYIDEFPWIIEAVRYRFPNVFIDEMQDTSKLQFDFLARVFDRDTLIVQRFGDSDQAIYDLQGPEDEQGSDFPVAPVLTLDDSRRFGPFIAEQVTALSLSSQQVLGKGPSEAKRNTIFLFEQQHIDQVLPAFGELVLAEFDGASVRAHAVGRRRTPGTGARVPTSIGDYWEGYSASTTSTRSFGEFADIVKRALEISLADGSYREASGELWQALKRWAALLGAPEPSSLIRALKSDAKKRRTISGAFYDLLKNGQFPDDNTWTASTSAIERILREQVGDSLNGTGTTFAAYPAEVPVIAPIGSQVYEHKSGDRTALIEMNSIHGVKSQTHSATLLLETSVRNSFDLKALLPYLSGRKALTGESLTPSVAAAVRCGFVAISRPQSLLCIAVRKDHVTPSDRRKLEERGWRIVEIHPHQQ